MAGAFDQMLQSKPAIWTGRIISALVVSCLLLDSAIRMFRMTAAVDGAARLGYSVDIIVAIGFVELACVVLYVIPRTAVLGAILLTGHLGGAAAAILRLQDPWFLFPIGIGVLVWGGLFLRDERLRALIPLRSRAEKACAQGRNS